MAAKTIFGKILEAATILTNNNTTPGTSTQVHKNFMSGIADYLEQHVKVMGSFTGVSGDSTMTTTITSTVMANSLRTDILSGGSGFGNWSNTFYKALQTKPTLKPGTFIPAGITPIFPRIKMSWTQEDIADASSSYSWEKTDGPNYDVETETLPEANKSLVGKIYKIGTNYYICVSRPKDEGVHGDCMDTIGNGLIKDMKTGYVTSIPGNVGSYVGTLTVSKIECD